MADPLVESPEVRWLRQGMLSPEALRLSADLRAKPDRSRRDQARARVDRAVSELTAAIAELNALDLEEGEG